MVVKEVNDKNRLRELKGNIGSIRRYRYFLGYTTFWYIMIQSDRPSLKMEMENSLILNN